MRKWLLIILGTLTWSVTMVKSGLQYSFGLGFWGANGHDAIWHLSLINSLSRFTLDLPIFSGVQIQNYHLGFDIFVAVLSRFSFLSPTIWYFQILPPLFAVAIGWLAYLFVKNNTKSDIAAWWSVFFVYFGTGLGWLLHKGESVFWAQQAISTLINPPFALSLVLLLIVLLALQKDKKVLAIICLVLLPQIKIYAGILAFVSLGICCLTNRKLLPILLISFVLALPVFLVLNSNSSGLIAINPGWFLESLFSPDRLDQPKFFSALNTYRTGLVWPKLIPAYLVAFTIFFIGNLGMRIFFIGSLTKPHTWEKVFLFGLILFGTLAPMLFLQKGTAWNTIQFFYYSLFATALLTGPVIESLLKKSKSLFLVSCFLIFALTIPGTLDSLNHYLPARPPAMLPNSELTALNFLSNQPSGVVLTQPYDPDAASAAVTNPPRTLQLYESTAYVSAYSRQPVYLEDQVNANILGLDWQERRKNVEYFFKTTDSGWQQTFLKDNHISYIYLTSSLPSPKINTATNELYSSGGEIILSTGYK